ncbi:hypothetical protein N7520_011683 [Penicillium odoratum]|uniref:uncharacterized protein n=1 Tax=Penicillium odoratum TaxID=1167516 RepID=UPI002547E4FE|nr:uncharacterized protein N7520_011683 [Penicillium odoratum]KAJ5746501.1 hypothetical protein N7520_011683 [Penicillium odoratum]
MKMRYPTEAMKENIFSSAGIDDLTVEDIRLLNQWNAHFPSAVDSCVPKVIHDRIRTQPNAPAVCSWDGEFTYAEIGTLSTRLALRLLSGPHGVTIRPGNFIPICMEKSRWVPIAILGVLKAGAAFAILDCNHPPERLQSICQDIEADLVLTLANQSKMASTLAPASVIVGEDLLQEESSEDLCEQSLCPSISPSSPFWAVFTSGSTGKPKAAIISHSAFVTGALPNIEQLEIGPKSRVFQFASYAFDVGIVDMLFTLIGGGCICVPSEWQRKNELSQTLNRLQANWVSFTSSLARILNPTSMPTLEYLHLVGETVTQREIDLWSPHVKLKVGYGPCEVGHCNATIVPDMTLAPVPNNIGHAPALCCWVVDPQDHHKLMPVGGEGELLLEGHALAENYFNQPQQTAAAFIDPPAWMAQDRRAKSGRKLYKCGDLVRYNNRFDGSLDFLGRKDTQVKIRGQRVELGEVEVKVKSCFSLARDVVAEVVAIKDKAPQLCVFLHCPGIEAIRDDNGCHSYSICGHSTPSFEEKIQELKLKLQTQLPAYMIPYHFIPITHVPMTTSIKTDRKLLREDAMAFLGELSLLYRDQPRASNSRDLSTVNGKLLQKLWAKVLNISSDMIDSQSNWVDLGADSLLAIKLVHCASQEGLLISVQDVLQNLNLAALAKVAKLGNVITPWEALEPFALLGDDRIEQQKIVQNVLRQYDLLDTPITAIDDIYRCTDDQVQSIHLSARRMGNLTMQIELTESNSEQFCDGWCRMLQDTPILRTEIVEIDGHYFQVVMKTGAPVIVRPSRPPHGTDIWGLKKPLVQLIREADSDRFTILFHHVLHDGFSLELFLQQLEAAYEGNRSPSTYPYTSFIKWTLETGPRVCDFWKNMFATYDASRDIFPPLPCPEYEPRGSSMLEKKVKMPKHSVHRTTVECKLRLALAVAISDATSNRDAVFGIHIARRDAPLPGIAHISGPTSASLPVRIQLNEGETLQEALNVVQKQALESIPYQCAELSHISTLSSETRAACQFRTSLMLQPDFSSTRSDRVAKWQFHEPRFDYWSLCFVAQVEHGGIVIWAFYDDEMIATSQVQDMLDRMGRVVDLIEQNPEIRIGEIP